MLLSAEEQFEKLQHRTKGLGSLELLSDDLLVFILRHVSLSDLAGLSLEKEKPEGKRTVDVDVWARAWHHKWNARRKEAEGDHTNGVSISFPTFFSDILYYSWYYYNLDFAAFDGKETIPRAEVNSYDEFFEKYAFTNKPVIITNLTKDWPCFQQWTKQNMSLKYLRKLAGAHKKKDYFLKYSSFFTNMLHIPDRSRAPARGDLGYSYATSKPPSNSQPTIQGSTKHGLPVFMNSKGELVPTKADSFQVPDFFSDDYFSVLGSEGRPAWRWLLVGARGSGSCFHQDPNFTSAWNASIEGRKKFVLFPGNMTPPGVNKIDEDNFEAPTTVLDWFVQRYPHLEEGTFLEGIVEPGEVIYVPSGWWHTVLNLGDTIAVTQNFVDHANILGVCSYLKYHKPELHEAFLSSLKEQKPTVFEKYCSASTEKSEWDKLMEGEDGDESFSLF